jgi:Sulfotransferase family
MALNEPSPPGAPGLLVVGGTMRGGTSLLRRLLDSHAQVHLMARELRALEYADLATWAHAAAVHQALTAKFDRLRDGRFRRQLYRYLSDIVRGHGLREPTTVDRIHHAFAVALADADTRYVGDKYPDYVLLYPQYIHRPNTRCLFMYRDVRDVVASIEALTSRGAWQHRRWATKYNTIEKATDYWLTVMQTLGDLRRLETNALAIGYEDLVLRTPETVAAIAHHLELADDGFDISLPKPSSIGRYRDRLSEQQVQAIERRAGAMMEAWGYTPGLRP